MAVRFRKGISIAYSSYYYYSAPSSVSRWANYCSWEGSNNNKKKKKIISDSDRLSGVIDAANDRKLPPELRGQRNNIRSETDIINVVEQRIWRSMEEGHFENLPGKGKPLNLDSNPHADPAEDTLYRILSKNNCAPEWVELNKGIRADIATWRLTLKKAISCKDNGDMSTWHDYSTSLKVQIRSINEKMLRNVPREQKLVVF
uniref:dnaJ homolog subfamily C member 28 isoform X2 n=1 Tax=Erigeron canadensis TaxID=72917 RepID=UPI001CB90ECF|nr:dnaJ homolog subfamily C member 28 isoform X2 [Erigeron canadensis]